MSMKTKYGSSARRLVDRVHEQAPDGARVGAQRIVGVRRPGWLSTPGTVAALSFDGERLAGGAVRGLELDVLDRSQRRIGVEPADRAVQPREDRRDRELVAGALEVVAVAQAVDELVRRLARVDERRNVPGETDQVADPAVRLCGHLALAREFLGVGVLPQEHAQLLEALEDKVPLVLGQRGLRGAPRLAERPTQDVEDELVERLVRRDARRTRGCRSPIPCRAATAPVRRS